MKYCLPFFIFLFGLFSCNNDENIIKKDDPDSNNEPVTFAVDVGDSDIPYIKIDTRGTRIENEPKIMADMDIYIRKEEVQSQTIGIEYRGSTSFRLSDKKSFGIETWDENGNDVDVSIFGFPEEEDWILNGHVVNMGEGYTFDRTLMYHQIAYEISRQMGKYASRTRFVELELNDEYMGVYVFMEKLKRDNNRIDVADLDPTDTDATTITGGYVLKIDKTSGGDLGLMEPLEYYENNWGDDARYREDFSFRSRYDIFGNLIEFPAYQDPYHPQQYLETYFIYENPDADEIVLSQKNYIQDYIFNFETALLTDDFRSPDRTYTNYIDVRSFVDYFLINEVCRNVDAYRLSTYLQKDRGGKLKMGPVWDMNIGFDSGDRIPIDGWVIDYNQYVESDPWMMPFWWPRLMEDPQFREAVKARWNELKGNVLSESNLNALVTDTGNYLKNNGAVKRNYDKWNIGVDYDAGTRSLKGYFSERISWMDSQIANF